MTDFPPEVVGGTGQHHTPTGGSPRQPYDQLDAESAQIMRAMPDRGSIAPEQLAVRTGLPLRIVLRRLPLLELADLVHRCDGGVALPNGGGKVEAALADLVSAYCAANPGQPLKPYEIARGITAATGRHLGTAAVVNCCLRLAAIGHLAQVAEAPMAFAFPAAGIPADEDRLDPASDDTAPAPESISEQAAPKYDGQAINAHWGHIWPTGNDVTDPGHENSPVLQAPVANLLGDAWYLDSESPGGDYVTWRDLADGRRVGVSPHLARDGVMRWVIGIQDQNGTEIYTEHELPITARPEDVAARVRTVMAEHDISQS